MSQFGECTTCGTALVMIPIPADENGVVLAMLLTGCPKCRACKAEEERQQECLDALREANGVK